jgi:hypothetical protein
VDELKIIMRAIFYQYARNLPNDIAGQVKDLDDRVTAWSVPHILSAVDHYMYYVKDIDTLPLPMALPVNLTRSGSKSLPSILLFNEALWPSTLLHFRFPSLEEGRS